MDAGEWRDWERLIDDRGIVIDRRNSTPRRVGGGSYCEAYR
jgi:hypothetical protein